MLVRHYILIAFALLASCTKGNPEVEPVLSFGPQPPSAASDTTSGKSDGEAPEDPEDTGDADDAEDASVWVTDGDGGGPDTAGGSDAGTPQGDANSDADATAPDAAPNCPGAPPLIQAVTGFSTPSVKVGDVAALTAVNSVSYHGGFSVSWSVASPNGSTSTFLPGPNVVSPIFPLDVPGQYTFSVQVTDECGLVSQFVWPVYTATPHDDDGFRFRLVWVGEGADGLTGFTPHGVANLDLHLMRPDAPLDPDAGDHDGDGLPDPYFDLYGGDCYWGSTSPDWGQPLASQDNPQVLEDGAWGPGPAVIEFEQPQALAYRLAVHYYEYFNGGDGLPASALVVVLKQGVVLSKTTMNLVPGDLWCVGMVNGLTGNLTPCPNLPNGPVTPNYPAP